MSAQLSSGVTPSPRLVKGHGLEGGIAAALAALIGARIEITYGIELGPVIALALIPVWARIPATYRHGMAVLILIPVAVATGVLLTLFTGADRPVFRDEIVSHSALILGVAGALGGLLWCRDLIGTERMTVLFGVGMVLGVPFNISTEPNQWRFTYSIPMSILLLALVSTGTRRLWLQLSVCGGLGVIGLLNDSRSNSAMLLLAAAVVLWQSADQVLRRGRGGSVMLAVWGGTIYLLVRSTILGGYFGEAILARTQEQINRSGGSLLLGGRPEIAASVELVKGHPWGLGSGVGTTYDDLLAAKASMSRIGYDPNNGYVEKFMFGRGIEVHSTLGDYWIWFGLPGLALGCLMLWVVVRGVQRGHDMTSLTVLSAYLATRFLWDLGFSPAVSGANLTVFCVAIFLRKRGALERPDAESVPREGQLLTSPDLRDVSSRRNSSGGSNR